MTTLSQADHSAIKAATPGAIKRIEREENQHRDWHEQQRETPPQAQWVKFESQWVLRIDQSPYMAVPATGRQDAAAFVVLDERDRRDYLCRLRKDEVQQWLWRAHKTYLEEITR